MPQSNQLTIENIAIPVDLERFIPPDVGLAVEYYGSYLRAGGTWKIQPFLCEVATQYAKYEDQHGRCGKTYGRRGCEATKTETLNQFISYIGLEEFAKIIKSCQTEYDRNMEHRRARACEWMD